METAKLISTYLEEFPSVISGEFCETCESDELVKLTNLEELFNWINTKEVEKGQNIRLENFEINEIDRIGKKIKLTNRHYFFPSEPKPYLWKVSKEESHLAQLKNKVDLRVDVIIGDNQKGNEWLKDPRIVLGKRIDVELKYTFFAWDDPKVQFMNKSVMSTTFHNSCKNYLSKKLISTISNSELFQYKNDLFTTVLKSEENEAEDYWLFKEIEKILKRRYSDNTSKTDFLTYSRRPKS